MDWNTVLNTSYTVSLVVDEEDLAMSVGSGDLPVLATPRMIALMEEAAATLIAAHLDEGITSVGVGLSTSHTAPTLPGATVYAEATLQETDGRRFVFAVRAYDDAGTVGEGRHERVTVKADRFLEKAAQRGA